MIHDYSRFRVHELEGFIQSMYLVEYENQLLLLDGGTKVDGSLVKNYIVKNLKRNFNDLKAVLVTHAHPDHSGGAFFYLQHDIEVYAPSGINNFYKGFSGFFKYLVDILLTYLVRSRRNSFLETYKNIFFKRSHQYSSYLNDGEQIPGFPDWHVKSCAGHTENDLLAFCESEKIGYIADNLIYTKNGFISPYPLMLPDEYVRSIKKLSLLKYKHFFLAHYGKRSIEAETFDIILNKNYNIRTHSNSIFKIFLRLFKR